MWKELGKKKIYKTKKKKKIQSLLSELGQKIFVL